MAESGLAKKMKLKEGYHATLINAPKGYLDELKPLPADVKLYAGGEDNFCHRLRGTNPGQLGENVTTRGVDLLGLPAGTRLHLGATAVVEVTGLRNPCLQLEGIHEGLMAAVLDRDEAGNVIRRAGIMAIVLAGGDVRPGDPIEVTLPPPPHTSLAPV